MKHKNFVFNGRLSFLALVTTLYLFPVPPAVAGPAAELAEWMIRQGGKFADDIAGKGARELATELEELSVKVGDDVLEQLVKSGGPGALRVVRGLGEHTSDAMRLIARHGVEGKLLVEQGRTLAVDVFREFGDDGVAVLVKEGASAGGKMLSIYGKALAGRKDITLESMAHLRHWMPEIEKASPEIRSVFAEKLTQGGDDFVVWVHKRWKELAVAGGLTMAGISTYKAGAGIAAAMPNPAKDPMAWLIWWLPVFVVVAIIAAAWVMRHALIEWIRAWRKRPRRASASGPQVHR